MSLRRFQNCNTLIINHFRNYGVEDELEGMPMVESELPWYILSLCRQQKNNGLFRNGGMTHFFSFPIDSCRFAYGNVLQAASDAELVAPGR